jgi:hypothetical protein
VAEDVFSFGSSLHSGLSFLEGLVSKRFGKELFWGGGGFGVGGLGVVSWRKGTRQGSIRRDCAGRRDCGSAFCHSRSAARAAY